jgi:RHS repeat-associated protein
MDQSGGVVARHDYLPFGEELLNTAGRTTLGFNVTSDVTQKFTGQVRDSESGQDYFNARYFTAALQRFNSVDPGNAGASLMSSQSWNGYGSVLGNPLNSADPSGRGCASRGGLSAHIVGCSGGGNYGPEDGGVSIDGGSPISVGTFGSGNPAGGESAVPGVSVTEVAWVPNGTKAPQNTEAYWFTSGASATINYYPQSSPWVISLGGSEFSPRSDESVGIDIWQGQQSLWANTAGLGNALTVGTAVVVAAPLAASLEAPTLLGNSVGRVVWSGPGNMAQATQYAATRYGTTLGQTLVGRGIQFLGALGVSTYPLWNSASAAFARGAQGNVVGFTQGASQASIFINTELPILENLGIPLVRW